MEDKKPEDDYKPSFPMPKPFVVPGAVQGGMPLKCKIRVAIMTQDGRIAPGSNIALEFNLIHPSKVFMSIREFFKRKGDFEQGLDYLKKLSRMVGQNFDVAAMDHMDEWEKF